MLTPWWMQVILFLAFAFNCWVLLPAAKWGSLGSYHHGLISKSLLTANGTTYPVLKVLTFDFSLNQITYEEYGPMYMGLQKVWSMFFDYTKLPAAVTWILTFGFTQVAGNLKWVIASR